MIIFTAREIGNATCYAGKFRQHPTDSRRVEDGEEDEEDEEDAPGG